MISRNRMNLVTLSKEDRQFGQVWNGGLYFGRDVETVEAKAESIFVKLARRVLEVFL